MSCQLPIFVGCLSGRKHPVHCLPNLFLSSLHDGGLSADPVPPFGPRLSRNLRQQPAAGSRKRALKRGVARTLSLTGWSIRCLWQGGRRVSAEQGKPGNWRVSNWRVSSQQVMVLVVVISGHLGLWMLLRRPVTVWQEAAPRRGDGSLVMELRFTHTLHPSPRTPALQTRRSKAVAAHIHAMLLAMSSKPPVVGRAAHVDRPAHGPVSTHDVLRTRLPDASAGEGSGNDGGFLSRLRKAQRSYSVHGVPGSDTNLVPGIHLVDPMKQGIGAVMRATQRAFGITSSHCIDVDVWRHLTPQELSARHISPDHVDRVSEKYGCNDPPGLHL